MILYDYKAKNKCDRKEERGGSKNANWTLSRKAVEAASAQIKYQVQFYCLQWHVGMPWSIKISIDSRVSNI